MDSRITNIGVALPWGSHDCCRCPKMLRTWQSLVPCWLHQKQLMHDCQRTEGELMPRGLRLHLYTLHDFILLSSCVTACHLELILARLHSDGGPCLAVQNKRQYCKTSVQNYGDCVRAGPLSLGRICRSHSRSNKHAASRLAVMGGIFGMVTSWHRMFMNVLLCFNKEQVDPFSLGLSETCEFRLCWLAVLLSYPALPMQLAGVRDLRTHR